MAFTVRLSSPEAVTSWPIVIPAASMHSDNVFISGGNVIIHDADRSSFSSHDTCQGIQMSPRRKQALPKRPSRKRPGSSRSLLFGPLAGVLLLLAIVVGTAFGIVGDRYTFSLQSPVRLRFQWPFVVTPKTGSDDATEARADQFGHRLTAYQQYACNKFGGACRVALAIQRAENPRGACEIYHYNTDGTLDWGYFQINTVHLTRVGLNLRDLLDCRANIDFAYQLYQERGFQPWSTYNNGAYRKFLRSP